MGEPRRDATELGEALCFGVTARRDLELAARLAQALGEVPGEQRDDDDRERVQEELIAHVGARDRVRRERLVRGRHDCVRREPEAQERVEPEPERRGEGRPAEADEHRADEDGQAVERRRAGRRTARDVDDRGPQALVDHEVHERERAQPSALSQDARLDGRDGVRERDRHEHDLERLRVTREAAVQVEERGRAEQQRGDEQPSARHPHEASARAEVDGSAAGAMSRARAVGGRGQFDLILPASEKIGRYIAMSTVPTTLPMPTIMMGSIMLVSAATATSTSSS